MVNSKECKTCNLVKNFEEFLKLKSGKYGLTAHCKTCYNKLKRDKRKNERSLGIIRKQNPKNNKTPKFKAYLKNRNLFIKYGITLDQKNKMSENQGGKCAICDISEINLAKPLCVDHNHSNGNVRALLCGSCNIAIGLMKENIASLQMAINYLKYYNKIL